MKELIDFSSLNEAFGLPACEPVWVDWAECCETLHTPESRHPDLVAACTAHSAETSRRNRDAGIGLFDPANQEKVRENWQGAGERGKASRGKGVVLINISTGVETTHRTIRDAARSIGCASTHISGIIKGKRKTIKGHTAREA